MSVQIVFENEHVIVADKPSGWLTVPARSAEDPRPCLGREIQAQTGRQIYPVHRLDFEVSGLTLWALTSAAHRVAQEWFEHSRVRKLYEALSTAGPGPLEWQEWKSKLARGKKRAFVAAHGKPSVTLARYVARVANGFKWELVAVTGRPHQLRFEMSAHGFPIVGDVLYGGVAPAVESQILLRAVELDLAGVPETARLGLPEKIRVPSLF